MQGTCLNWSQDRNDGTLMGEDGNRYYCHFSAIQSSDINLDPGEKIIFEPSEKQASGMNVATLVKRI